MSSHKKYVNCVVVAYTLDGYPNGVVITGSNDQTIAFHDIESNKLLCQLKEHDGAGNF
jgi:WD40 repeat protein